MKKWGQTGYFRRRSGYFKEFAVRTLHSSANRTTVRRPRPDKPACNALGLCAVGRAHPPPLALTPALFRTQEDWKASRTDAWLRKARRDALLLAGLRFAVWSFIILLIISVNILVVGYMVQFYADLLQLSRSVFVSLAYQLFVAEPVR